MIKAVTLALKLTGTTSLLLALGACASSSATIGYHYLLPAAQQVVSPAATLPSVAIQLPDYLDRPGIVMQLNEVGLRSAHDHLWAEPLEQQLAHAMRAYLSDMKVNQGGKLNIELVRFQGNIKGLATIAGSWQLDTADGRHLQGDFSRGYLLKESGYDELVLNLNKLWKGLAASIAKQLNPEQQQPDQQQKQDTKDAKGTH